MKKNQLPLSFNDVVPLKREDLESEVQTAVSEAIAAGFAEITSDKEMHVNRVQLFARIDSFESKKRKKSIGENVVPYLLILAITVGLAMLFGNKVKAVVAYKMGNISSAISGFTPEAGK